MKIKVLRNLGRGLPPYKENQVVDASKEDAEMLIKRGLAEAVNAPMEVRGVADSPKIAKPASTFGK